MRRRARQIQISTLTPKLEQELFQLQVALAYRIPLSALAFPPPYER